MRDSVRTWDPWSLDANERTHIRRVMIEAKWNKAEAARLLRISRRALYRLLTHHGLDRTEAMAA